MHNQNYMAQMMRLNYNTGKLAPSSIRATLAEQTHALSLAMMYPAIWKELDRLQSENAKLRAQLGDGDALPD